MEDTIQLPKYITIPGIFLQEEIIKIMCLSGQNSSGLHTGLRKRYGLIYKEIPDHWKILKSWREIFHEPCLKDPVPSLYF